MTKKNLLAKMRGFCHRGRFDTVYLKHSSFIIDTFFRCISFTRNRFKSSALDTRAKKSWIFTLQFQIHYKGEPCLKIIVEVLFYKISSEASYVYFRKFRMFQYARENGLFEFKCDIFGDFLNTVM